MSQCFRSLVRIVATLAVTIGGTLILGRNLAAQAGNQKSEEVAEKLVQAQTADDILDSGMLFLPARNQARPIAVIWIHGWGVNFYYPTYIEIGRALTRRGYAAFTVNTRMHDIGNVEAWRGEKRIRGGGYWGVPSEQVRDLKAWIDYAEAMGFKKVILIGHSDGWPAVRRYQAETQDPRVAGLVLASGPVDAGPRPTDPAELEQANKMLAEGRPEDLVRIPKRSSPSFISAATYVDILNTPPELWDFFGVRTPNPAVTRILCPLLAFYGTDGDVGSQKDLELLKSLVKRQRTGPSRVDTFLIKGTGHMYAKREEQVAEVIARWADSLRARNEAAK